MDPFTAVGLGVALLLGYFLLEKGMNVPAPVVVRTGGGGGPSTVIVPTPTNAAAPAGSASVGSVPVAPVSTSSAPTSNAPAPSSPASSPSSGSALDLSWIFGSGQDAIKAGYGQVFKQGADLFTTGPKGPVKLLGLGTIYGSKADAQKAGVGAIYQENGKYQVFAPGFPVQLSDKFQPHAVAQDFGNYGAVSGGVLRGWALQVDGSGNYSSVPAHSVAGSTYQGDAIGNAPSLDEWQKLASARGSLPQRSGP